MTVLLALRAIKSFLEGELSGDITVKPAIHIGFLPQKNRENANESEYPFIIVRPMDCEDAEFNSTTIKLIFGTKAEDDEGYQDCLNIMERTRIALLKKRILDQRYRLETPYKWKFFEEQPHPEWIGEAVTRWTLPTVIEEVEGL